jgi:Xaa-Pro aminopeptidase
MGMLRVVKDADELRRLRRASEVSAEAHVEAMRQARAGRWEYEVEAIVEYTFRRHGAERVGYPSIVGSGINSTILHYDVSRRQTRPGDLRLIDAAAEWGYYTADLTRTFVVGTAPDSRQQATYQIVRAAQERAVAQLRSGIPGRQGDALARDLIAERGVGEAFGHSLGHGLGLEVHEAPRLSPVADGVLPEGAVVTIEPGVYLPGWGGVRIEDDVLLGTDRAEPLTGFPRSLTTLG